MLRIRYANPKEAPEQRAQKSAVRKHSITKVCTIRADLRGDAKQWGRKLQEHGQAERGQPNKLKHAVND